MSTQQKVSHVQFHGQEQGQAVQVQKQSQNGLKRLLIAGLLSLSLLGGMAATRPNVIETQPSQVEDVTELPLLAGCHQGGGCG